MVIIPAALGAVLLLTGCSGKTTGATDVTASSADLQATANCDQGLTCLYYWEWWRASKPRSTSTKSQVHGLTQTSPTAISQHITGLKPNTAYRWVLCGSPNNGGNYFCTGPNGTLENTTDDPPKDYDTFTTQPATTNVQIPPLPDGAINDQFNGVSCTSTTSCMAVGYSDDNHDASPLAGHWDGASWTIVPVPVPTGTTLARLFGVSCPSEDSCTAVGGYQTGGPPEMTLVEHWDGTSWTIQTSPNQTSSDEVGHDQDELRSVSCTSANSCVAVGSWTFHAGQPDQGTTTLAASWDGTTWTLDPAPPLSAGASSGGVLAVTCTSATSCEAVGTVDSTPGQQAPLADHWDGSAWTVQTTQQPAGSSGSNFYGVSCASATACTAVGDLYTTNGGVRLTLAERWDGSSWTIQTTPNPSDAAYAGPLNSVSCPTSRACFAVGSYHSTSGSDLSLVERWNRKGWAIVPSANPSATDNELFGISCVAAAECTAAGRIENADSTFSAVAGSYPN